jgi:hypothetical protein
MLTRQFAVGLVRFWCRLYTWDMSPRLAASRLAEIESDLWELQHDPEQERDSDVAWRIVGRLLMGIADDVAWRIETAMDDDDPFVRRFVAFTAAATLLILALWTLPTWSASQSMRRTAVTDCADETTPSQRTPDSRIRVMQCAGVFFTPHAKSAADHAGP